MNFLQTILVTTILLEIITLIGRFAFNISTKHIWIKSMKHFGFKHWFHFHHVFVGLIVIFVSLINYNPVFLAIGIGISLSDLIHHIILALVVGNPEFHLVYSLGAHKSKNKLHKHLVHKLTQENIQKEK